MADVIIIKAGNTVSRSSVPALSENELAYSKDEKALYIGTGSGNLKLCSAGDIERLAALEAKVEELTAQTGSV